MAIRIGKRKKTPAGAIMAILAGGTAAAGVMLTPMALIEMVVSASGLAALIPAAAPPLGETARLVLAFAAGVSGMALAGSLYGLANQLRRRGSAIRIGYDIGFEEEDDEPVFLRSSDAPRRPIFASSELADVAPLARNAPPAPEDLRMPVTPEPLDDAELELSAAMAIIDAPAPKMPAAPEPVAAMVSPVEDPAGIVSSLRTAPADHSALSITELVQRFEIGLKTRRAQIADAVNARKTQQAEAEARAAWLEPARVAPASPPEPQRKTIDAEVDEALRAALGTLQRMTARAA